MNHCSLQQGLARLDEYGCGMLVTELLTVVPFAVMSCLLFHWGGNKKGFFFLYLRCWCGIKGVCLND